jgi:spore maturation protein A
MRGRDPVINVVWVVLLVAGILVGAWQHRLPDVTQAAVSSAEKGVEVALGFVGIMTLWLGMARIAEESGLLRRLAGGLAPILRRLFPALPADDPALGNISMNLVANMLGMGGAATPFGLKAMRDLARRNPTPDTATNHMITFLALNTAALNLVPATVIALRAAAGSRDPTIIVGPTIVATACAMGAAVTADWALRRRAGGATPRGGGRRPRPPGSRPGRR